MSGANRTLPVMSETLIGYARCSTDTQDLTAQRDRLRELGVAENRVYLDRGLTGTNRRRPGLDQALAAVRDGDTLVVPKLDRLARSVPDARAIGDDLASRGIKLSLGGQVYDPADPMGKMFFNILATFAEFIRELIVEGTHEGLAAARARGTRLGRPPAMTAETIRQARALLAQPDNTVSSIARLLGVSRATLYKHIPEITTAGLPPDLRPAPDVAGYDTLLPSGQAEVR